MKSLAELLTIQLRALASEDDQLGRGEYDVFGVEPGRFANEFIVTAGWPGSEEEPRRFLVQVSQLIQVSQHPLE